MRIAYKVFGSLAIISMALANTGGGQELEERSFGLSIDSLLAPWDSTHSPGVAVLVQHRGRTVYKRGVGMAVLEHGVPITPQTSFDLASVSKHITSFAVLMLERESTLDRDDDIRQYLPELPHFAQAITVRDLLHQTSGLWEFWTILNQYGGFRSRDYFTMGDVLNLLAHQPALTFEPGTRYGYTNTNYSLLAEIVARATGVPFGQWTKEHIFDPLDMRDTYFQEDCTTPIPGKATAYERRDGAWILSRPSNVEVPGSAHAFTTLDDMEKWLRQFHARTLAGETLFHEWTTRGTLKNGQEISYAAGLNVRHTRGTTVIGHSGQTGGYKTMLIYAPEEELGIVVLANARSVNAYGLAYEILDRGMGWPTGERESGGSSGRATVELDPTMLDRFGGGYRIAATNQLAGVYREGDYLGANVLGLGKDYFQPLSDTLFVSLFGSTRLRFHLDGTGRVTGLTLVIEDEDLMAARIAVDPAQRETARDLAGAYYSDALGAVCHLRQDGGRIILSHRRYPEDVPLEMLEADHFVGSWGFVHVRRNERAEVQGFELTDEVFGYKNVWFVRIPGWTAP